MDRLSFDVQGCNAGRGENGNVFSGIMAKIFKQGRFTRSGLAGNEDVPVRFLHDMEGLLKFGVDLDK